MSLDASLARVDWWVQLVLGAAFAGVIVALWCQLLVRRLPVSCEVCGRPRPTWRGVVGPCPWHAEHGSVGR